MPEAKSLGDKSLVDMWKGPSAVQQRLCEHVLIAALQDAWRFSGDSSLTNSRRLVQAFIFHHLVLLFV